MLGEWLTWDGGLAVKRIRCVSGGGGMWTKNVNLVGCFGVGEKLAENPPSHTPLLLG